MTFKIEDGKLAKDDRDFISVASPKPVLFKALCNAIDRAEAAEATAAELLAKLATAHAKLATVTTERDTLYSRCIELADSALTLSIECNKLTDMISQYHAGIPTDEWSTETPYGQMLDGIGDEVEP